MDVSEDVAREIRGIAGGACRAPRRPPLAAIDIAAGLAGRDGRTKKTVLIRNLRGLLAFAFQCVSPKTHEAI
jgi:hypothetical protein